MLNLLVKAREAITTFVINRFVSFDHNIDGSHKWQRNAANYASFSAAVLSCGGSGSKNCILIVTDIQEINTDISVLGHIKVVALNGGKFKTVTSKTLHIENFSAGPYKIFEGFSAGDITLGDKTPFALLEWFGGSPSESVANNDTAINLLAQAFDGIKRISAGTWECNSIPMNGGSGRWIGEGVGITIFKQPTGETRVDWVNIGSDTFIEHIEFWAEASNGQFHRIQPVEDADNIIIENCKTHGFSDGYGVYIGNNSSNIRLINNDHEAGFYGLTVVEHSGLKVIGSNITTTGVGPAIDVEPNVSETSEKTQFIGCYINGNGGPGLQYNESSVVNGAKDLLISGCVFEDCSIGIRKYLTSNLTVVGCTFKADVIIPYRVQTSGANFDIGNVIWRSNQWEDHNCNPKGGRTYNLDMALPIGVAGATNGWIDSGGANVIVQDITVGLSGGDGGVPKSCHISGTAQSGNISQLFAVRQLDPIEIVVVYKHAGSAPTPHYPEIRINAFDETGAAVEIYSDSAHDDYLPMRLLPSAGYDTDWHTARLLWFVNGTGGNDITKLQVLVGTFSNTDHDVYIDSIEVIGARSLNLPRQLFGFDTWNPGNIANGAEEVHDITVPGVTLEDFANASFSLDVADLTLTAAVTAADTVTAQLSNSTGGAIDLGSGTINTIVTTKPSA